MTSQSLTIGLFLAGALLQKTIGNLRAVQKEAVPGLPQWRNDALATPRPHIHPFDLVRKSQLSRKPDRLASIVDKTVVTAMARTSRVIGILQLCTPPGQRAGTGRVVDDFTSKTSLQLAPICGPACLPSPPRMDRLHC